MPAQHKQGITQMQTFADQHCRKCNTANPMVFFAPINVAPYSCICFDCAKSRNWLDQDGNLAKGVEL
jgi:hypothetical protein